MAAADRIKEFSGADKATALLLAMGKPLADRVVKQLHGDEIKLIARSAATLGAVERKVVNELVDMLVNDLTSGSDLVAGSSEAERLISGVVAGEEAVEIMADVQGNKGRAVWPRLSKSSEIPLAQFLAKEHPQVSAFVLTKVAPEMAATIIGQMPQEARDVVMRRMLSIKPVLEPAVALLEETLSANLLSGVATNVGPNLHARMADILNKLDKPQMDAVLKGLEDYRPKEAAIVRGLLFTFEDIVKLSIEARSRLFDEVPTEVVVVALQGVPPNVLSAALGCMSGRARKLIEQELQGGAAAQKKDILKAQRQIADLALDLADRGKIELHPEED